jgi:stage II sporulation protein E
LSSALYDRDIVVLGVYVLDGCISIVTHAPVLASVFASLGLIIVDSEVSVGRVHYNCIDIPIYTVQYGAANLPKSTVSGDLHSISAPRPADTLAILCDGMGSGVAARAISNAACTLTQSFYRAGLDWGVGLELINSMLMGDETFAALDIVSISCADGNAHIVKLGSPCSYIVYASKTEVVSSNALPLGAVEEMRPFATKRQLAAGDMIVLVTDGVSDCFEHGTLGQYVDCNRKTPQELADGIMQAALQRCVVPQDDMSVVVLQLIGS